MKRMLELIRFFLITILLISSSVVYAESFVTESFSAEGAELECNVEQNSPLLLNVYGETFNCSIFVNKDDYYDFKVLGKFNYYDLPMYYEHRIIMTATYEFYIKNGELVSSSLIDSTLEVQYKNIFDSIKEVLNEAHDNNKCLTWSFESK